jgi:outer membrane protein
MTAERRITKSARSRTGNLLPAVAIGALVALFFSHAAQAQDTNTTAPAPPNDSRGGTPPVRAEHALISPPPVAEKGTLHTDFRAPGPFFLIPYLPPHVSASRETDSDRLSQLIRGGVLYLSLQDAIDLAVENNFDVELQRFDHEFALTEILRAKGGGTLRGVPTSISELPAGEGGPGEPLLTTVGGYAPVLSLPSSAADLATITATGSELSVASATPLSSGTPVPQFDPVLTGNLSVYQQIYGSPSSFTTGSNIIREHGLLANLGYMQAFSPGTQLTVSANTDALNESDINNNLNPANTGYLSVALTQPLLQGFGIRVNRRFIRIAKNEDKIADFTFRQQLIATVADTTRLYFDLVSLTADLEVKRQSLTASQRLYDDTKNRVEQGTDAPLQLTSAQAQLEIAKQDYISSEGLTLQQELLLKELLTRKGISDPALADARINTISAIPPPQQEDIAPLSSLVDQASRNRPDLVLARTQLENSNIQLEGSRNAMLPQLNIVASMQNNGIAGQMNAAGGPNVTAPPANLVGGYGTVENQIFSRDYPSFTAGIQFNFPLRNRVARADVTRDQLEIRATEVRMRQLDSQVRLQVGNAQIALKQAKSAYIAAVEARKLQEQAVNVEQARYDEGVDILLTLIQYQRDLAQARSSEVTALGVYAKAKAALERAVGLTLQDNNIDIGEAYKGKISQAPSAIPATAPPAPAPYAASPSPSN